MHNAGHILGSSMIHLNIGNGMHNMLYSADSKFGKTQLLEPAHTRFQRLETLIIESTYGGRDNVLPPKKECEDFLGDIITKTIKNRGKILIPVLGSGRAQEVMLIVENMVRNGQISDDIDVFIDGMVWDITAIHSAYPEYLNRNVRKRIFHKNQNPFLNPIFKRVGSAKERKQVIEDSKPCIVLATSGMLVGGPSVEYLKCFAGSERNSLVFVSYQGEGSLGRRIQRGEREIAFAKGNKIEQMALKMEVNTIEGFTGHSGRKQLMNFIHRLNPKPRKVIINHGENSRCLDLASSIHKVYRIESVAPKNLESIRIR